jgi:hypothetical protein
VSYTQSHLAVSEKQPSAFVNAIQADNQGRGLSCTYKLFLRRFLKPTPAGFRDLNLNVLLHDSMHVAEVQVGGWIPCTLSDFSLCDMLVTDDNTL